MCGEGQSPSGERRLSLLEVLCSCAALCVKNHVLGPQEDWTFASDRIVFVGKGWLSRNGSMTAKCRRAPALLLSLHLKYKSSTLFRYVSGPLHFSFCKGNMFKKVLCWYHFLLITWTLQVIFYFIVFLVFGFVLYVCLCVWLLTVLANVLLLNV